MKIDEIQIQTFLNQELSECIRTHPLIETKKKMMI